MKCLYRIHKFLLSSILIALVVIVGWISYHHGNNYDGHRTADPGVVISNFDGDGHVLDVIYPKVPKRVLSTYPGATELLIALGLDSSIVATVAPYGVEPISLAVSYNRIPKVEAPFVPTKEEVLSISPDLIIGWNHHFQPNALGDVRNWHNRNVATYVVPATVRQGHPTLESTVYPFIDDIGKIFNVESRAEAYRKSLEQRVQQVQDRVSNHQNRPTVLILQSYGNSTYSVYGERYIIYDIVEKAGGKTVTENMLKAVGPERILGYDPDYIVLVMSRKTTDDTEFEQSGQTLLLEDSKINSLRAIRNHHIITVDFGAVNNGNGRTVDVLEQIAAQLDKAAI